MGLDIDRIFAELPDVPFRDHVWPKFLYENAARVLQAVSACGPLAGIRVVELPNIGPVQFAGMLLSDLGAEVLRARPRRTTSRPGERSRAARVAVLGDRPRPAQRRRRPQASRRRRGGAAAAASSADVLLEGFRPGVAERLGVGPDACRARNPRLVYARMTGWGQDGPLASDVGHDINYLSLAGVLWHIGPAGGPPRPADQPARRLRRRRRRSSSWASSPRSSSAARSGEGQVVDAAMVDGSAQLMSIFFGIDAMGGWGPRGTNLLDGGAHFYNVYETRRRRVRVDRRVRAEVLRRTCSRCIGPLGFDDLDPAQQMDTRAVAGAQGTVRRAVPHQDARRVGRVLRRPRGVLRARAPDARGARASAQRRARDLHRRRRRAAARARAALLPHAVGGAGRAGRGRQPHRHRARRLGLRRRRESPG